MDGGQDALFREGPAQRVGLVGGKAHAAAALVLEGGEAPRRGVGGDGLRVKFFDGVAVRQARRAETRLTHTDALPFDNSGRSRTARISA